MKVDYLYKLGGKESAAYIFNRHQNTAVLKLTIEVANAKFDLELNVEDAKALASELLDYANEIEEYAEIFKGEPA